MIRTNQTHKNYIGIKPVIVEQKLRQSANSQSTFYSRQKILPFRPGGWAAWALVLGFGEASGLGREDFEGGSAGGVVGRVGRGAGYEAWFREFW